MLVAVWTAQVTADADPLGLPKAHLFVWHQLPKFHPGVVLSANRYHDTGALESASFVLWRPDGFFLCGHDGQAIRPATEDDQATLFGWETIYGNIAVKLESRD